MMRRFLLVALLFLACGVQSAIGQQCTLTISGLGFGPYTSAQIDSTATGRVTNCTGTSWTITMNQGNGAGATVTDRRMTGPGGILKYQLSKDLAQTTNWDVLTGTGNFTFTVYGRLAAGQYLAPGTYTDTVSTATTSFTITATISAACSVTATQLAFGNYSGILVNSTSTITATCTKSIPYNVGLSAGTATGATVTTRKMTGPSASTLSYSLFRDSGRNANWGITVGTDTVLVTGTGIAQPITVYGQVPAGQFVRPGAYADTITVTITY